MTKRIGILDVAVAAGVSVTTVSHALSGRGQVSEQTRSRVERIAAEMGYAPNRIASALRRQRSGVVGFVSDEIATTPFAGRVVLGAQEAAAEHGVLLMVVNSNHDPLVEDDQIGALLAQQVDAIVYATMFHQRVEVPHRLHRTPTVLVDAFDPDSRVPWIVPDELDIGVRATRYLQSAGHRRIAHLTIDEPGPGADGRRHGYAQAMSDAGQTPLVIAVQAPADTRAGREAVERALAVDPDVTAVFCFNDQMAMGVYQQAPVLGRMVGVTLSVVGVDNLELIAAELRPSLTTIALPHYEMGRWAVQEALRLSSGTPEGGEPSQIALRCRLVERESVSAVGMS